MAHKLVALATGLSMLCMLLVASSAAVQAARELTPAEVAAKFFRAMEAGDADAAESLMAGFDRLQEEAAREIRAELREHAAAMNKGGKVGQTQIVAHLQLDRVALVVFSESQPGALRIDLDPAYLIQRGENWRLLPEVTEYDSPAYGFDERTLASMRSLESWFDEQKPKVVELLKTQRP